MQPRDRRAPARQTAACCGVLVEDSLTLSTHPCVVDGVSPGAGHIAAAVPTPGWAGSDRLPPLQAKQDGLGVPVLTLGTLVGTVLFNQRNRVGEGDAVIGRWRDGGSRWPLQHGAHDRKMGHRDVGEKRGR